MNCKNIIKAIIFLAYNYIKTGYNPKPVIAHSFRVAFSLIKYGEEAVITALLHDLIEDSEVAYENIKKEFGTKIADNVLLLTIDKEIKDRTERDKNNLDKIITAGDRVIIIVKLDDILDNSRYIKLVKSKEERTYLIKKIEYFLKKSEYYKNERPWKMLCRQYQKLKNTFLQ